MGRMGRLGKLAALAVALMMILCGCEYSFLARKQPCARLVRPDRGRTSRKP